MPIFHVERLKTNRVSLVETQDAEHMDGNQLPAPHNCEEDTIQDQSLFSQQNGLQTSSNLAGNIDFHQVIRNSITYDDTRSLKLLSRSSPTWLLDNFVLPLHSVDDLDLKICERCHAYGPLSYEMLVFLEEEFGLQHLFVSMSNLSRGFTTETELLNTVCASLDTFSSYADRFLIGKGLIQHRMNYAFFSLIARSYDNWMQIRVNQKKYIKVSHETLKKIQLTLTNLLMSLHEFANIFSTRDKIRQIFLRDLTDNEEPFSCWEMYQRDAKEMAEVSVVYKMCRFGRLQRNLLDDLSRAFNTANVTPSDTTSIKAVVSQPFVIMKDIYALDRVLYYLDLALSSVLKSEGSSHSVNNLVLERALQVTGEYLKVTEETPNLSKEIQSKLTAAGVQVNLLAEVRNLLSHYSSKDFFSEIKSEDTDVSLVENAKNDLEKVRGVILKVMRDVKIKQIQNLLNVKGFIPDEKNGEVIKLVKDILSDMKRSMSKLNIKETIETLMNILEKHKNLIAVVEMAIQDILCLFLPDIVQNRLNQQNTDRNDRKKFGIYDHKWNDGKSAITAISSLKQIEHFKNTQLIAKYDDKNSYGLTLADIFVKVIMTNALSQKESGAMENGFQEDIDAMSLNEHASTAAFFLLALNEAMINGLGDKLNSQLDAYLYDSNTCELLKVLKIDETRRKDFHDLLSKFRLQTVMMAKHPQVLDDILAQAIENVSAMEINADEPNLREALKKLKVEVESKKAIHVARTKLLVLCSGINKISKEEFSELVKKLQCDVNEKERDEYYKNRRNCKKAIENKVTDPYGKVLNEMKKELDFNGMKKIFIGFTAKLQIHQSVKDIFHEATNDVIGQKIEQQFFDTLDLVAKVRQEIEKYGKNASERLNAALEMAVLKGLNALGSITDPRSYTKLEKMLYASAGQLLGNDPNYVQLRNYLAHGDVTVDINMQDFLKVFADILVKNGQTIIAIHKIMINEENRLFLQAVLKSENVSLMIKQNFDVFGRDFCAVMQSEYCKNSYLRTFLLDVLTMEETFSDATPVGNISDVSVDKKFSFSEFLKITTQDLCTAVSFGDLCGTQFFFKHIKLFSGGNHRQLNLLHLAAGSNNLDVIQTLLQEGFNANTTDEIHYTPLHFAVLHQNTEAVRCLLANMANARAKDVNGYAPLHIAAFSGAVNIVALLNQHGANVREISKVGVTPLWLAVLNGHADVVEALLGARALVDMPEEQLNSLTRLAVVTGHAPILRALMDHGSKLDCLIEEGRTLLHLASENGHLEVVKLLVDRGPAVNIGDVNSITPLHLASTESIAETLLDSGADVDSSSSIGTPLHAAVRIGASQVVKVLLRKKASVNTADQDGYLAIQLAAINGNVDTMRLLVNAGASVNCHRDIDTIGQQKMRKETLLFIACENGHFDMVTLLLELQADVDDISYDSSQQSENILGWPLQIAIGKGHFEIAEKLLEHGANIGIMDEDNTTALHYASFYGNLTVVKKLLERGADVNAVCIEDGISLTPIYLSVRSQWCQSCDIMQILIDHGADLNYKAFGDTLLVFTVSCLNFQAVELLLKNGFNINAHGSIIDGTALHSLIKNPQRVLYSKKHVSSHKMLRLLLDNKANVDASDMMMNTPLHLAAKCGYTYAVKTLLSYGAITHQLNREQKTPFQEAEGNNHIECCALLQHFENKTLNTSFDTEQIISQEETFENEIDYTKKTLLKTKEIWIRNIYKGIVKSDDLKTVQQLLADKAMADNNVSNYNLLHFCVITHKLGIMKVLLEYGLDINQLNNEGLTPLHLATQMKNTDAVKWLLSSGADVNRVTKNEKQSALHIAVKNGAIEILQLLLDSDNVNTDAIDYDNETPLILACKLTHPSDTACDDQDVRIGLLSKDIQPAIIEMLLQHGANVQTAGKMGNRPLHHCVNMGTMQVLQMLINRGANVNCINSDNYTPLHIAAQKGNEIAIEFLLKNDANVNDVNDVNDVEVDTPLHLAVDKGFFSIMELLIKNNANVDAVNGKMQTPLHLAASTGNYKMVDYLLMNAAYTEIEDLDKCTPLFFAVREGHYGVLQLLAKKGACVNVTCEDEWAVIHEAVKTGDVAIVEEVLKHGGQVNSVNKYGLTPLHLAIRRDLINIVELLLAHKAETNVPDCAHSYPIHVACKTGNHEIVEMLIKAGAEVNCCDQKKNTPLITAVDFNHENCIQVLLNNNAGIEFDSYGEFNCQALFLAVSKRNLAAVKMLIENGADLSCKMRSGSFMHIASIFRSVECLKIFYNHGLNVDESDNFDNATPLHAAVKMGHAPCVKYLLEVGADIEAPTKLGMKTPLLWAAQLGRTDIIQMLLSNGADANRRDKLGSTALHYAVFEGHLDAVKALLHFSASVTLEHSSSNMDIFTDMKSKVMELPSLLKLENQENVREYTAKMNTEEINEILQTKEASAPKNILIDAVNVNNWAPLLAAIMKGYHEIAIELIEMGADVNFMNSIGISPLMLSIAKNLPTVTHCLIKHGADVNVANNQMLTALHFAIHMHSSEMIQYLLENGADINVQNTTCSLLHFASRYDNQDIIQHVLNLGLNVNAISKEGLTPLHIAAFNGFVKTVSALLANEANVNATISFGRTPLHLAVLGIPESTLNGNVITVDKRNEFQSTAKSLIFKGADVNAVCDDYKTPLHIAAYFGFTSFLELLLENGANVNGSNLVNTDTPLHLAAENGHAEIVRLLLLNGKCRLDLKNANGDTALHVASTAGHLKAVEVLIQGMRNNLEISNIKTSQCEAKVQCLNTVYDSDKLSTEIQVNQDPKRDSAHQKAMSPSANFLINMLNDQHLTPLLASICEGHKDIAITLIEAGADVNGTNSTDDSPLMLAILKHLSDVAYSLMGHDADTNAVNGESLTALHFAIIENDSEVLQYLKNNGASTDVRSEDGGTLLHFASVSDKHETIPLLLKFGLNINAMNDNGKTCLHLACYYGHASTVAVLLQNGANVNARDVCGRTPLFDVVLGLGQHTQDGHETSNLEKEDEFLFVAKSLILKHADVNATDLKNTTALHAAVNLGQTNFVQLLLDGNAKVEYGNFSEDVLLPQHLAAQHQSVDVKLLIGRGAVVDRANRAGFSALSKAIQRGNLATAKWLLECGATAFQNDVPGSILHHAALNDSVVTLKFTLESLPIESDDALEVNARDTEYRSSLMVACECGHSDTAELLLMIGANVNATDKNNCLALHFAAKSGLGSLVSILLDYGSDTNFKNKEGLTALYVSVRFGHLEVVKVLLRNNASVTERYDHYSILHAATTCKNQKILKLILVKLKNESQFYDYLNARDEEGDTPLMWAAEGGHLEAAKILLQCGAMEKIKNYKGMTALDWATNNKHDKTATLITNYNSLNQVPSEDARFLFGKGPVCFSTINTLHL